MGKYPGVPHARQKFSGEVRIGAVADYLIGKSLKEIYDKWGVSSAMVNYWVRRAGSFKLRHADAATGPRKSRKRVLVPRTAPAQFAPPADQPKKIDWSTEPAPNQWERAPEYSWPK